MSSSPSKNFARRIARPFTRPLDGRVADINRRVGDARSAAEEHGAAMSERVEELTRKLGAYATTAAESNSYVGVEMRRFEESIEALRTHGEALRTHIDEHEARLIARVDALDDRSYVDRVNRAAEAPLEHLDGAVANLINHASGHRGFAARAGLWFNPPVTVELSEGQARLATINERIVELPFALGQLARLDPPARVLDVGGAESTFALSAASLGYQVTVIDPQGVPYEHPNLRSFSCRLEEWEADDEPFAAAFLISAIEHFGLGAYGEPKSDQQADRAALVRMRELLAADGRLVLTTPWGEESSVSDFERIYDDAGLETLLEGWQVLERHTITHTDARTWVPGIGGAASTVLVTATPLPG
jgi:hypothetical protein